MQPLQDQIGHLQSEVQRLSAQVASVDLLKTEVAGLSAEVETLRTKLATMADLEAEVSRLRDLTSTSADRTVVSVTTQSAKSAGKARAMYVVVASTFLLALTEPLTEICRTKRHQVLPHKRTAKLHRELHQRRRQKLHHRILASLRTSWASTRGSRMTARSLA